MSCPSCRGGLNRQVRQPVSTRIQAVRPAAAPPGQGRKADGAYGAMQARIRERILGMGARRGGGKTDK
jgi:hypothetical protein